MKSSARGILLVIGLFAFGGLVLAGLYMAPRAKESPPAPLGEGWGAPGRPVRFLSYNILHNRRGREGVIAEIKQHDPDFVLLQEVESADVAEMASALSMQKYFDPKAYQPSVNLDGPKATWGNCILSKYPIYDCGPIPNPGGGTFGVWAVAEVDGKKFLLADVHLSATWNANPIHIKQSGENRAKELENFLAAWKAKGSPPLVLGGDFNQIPIGNNYAAMTRDLADAMARCGADGHTFTDGMIKTRIDYFLISKEWEAKSASIGTGDASDHFEIVMEAREKNAAASRP